jgi:hypothetical protein
MASDIFESPLDAIEMSDIKRLVDLQSEEGPRSELKRSLATNDGRPDRWMRDQSSKNQIGTVQRAAT